MKVTNQFVLFFGNNDICSNFFLCNITYNGIDLLVQNNYLCI